MKSAIPDDASWLDEEVRKDVEVYINAACSVLKGCLPSRVCPHCAGSGCPTCLHRQYLPRKYDR